MEQLLHLEPVAAEEREPVAVGQLELGHTLGPRDAVITEPAPLELVGRACLLVGQPLQETRDTEHQQTAGTQQAGDLRHGDRRVAEAHRAVVAEHDVERPVRERHRLAAGLHQRDAPVVGMTQLLGRLVEPDDAGAVGA
ncbi:MAG TPA: hypothetical protein VMQ81_06055 [Acidimicrobiia bacterium]|nr:hypothetical protein [Acidimicrobiia bacterium]